MISPAKAIPGEMTHPLPERVEPDRERIQPMSDKVRHAYPVRRPYNSESYIIRAKAFLKYYDIDASRPLAFKPQVEEGVVVFEPDKGAEVRRRGGRRKGTVKKTRP